jgi:hypothetical protein
MGIDIARVYSVRTDTEYRRYDEDCKHFLDLHKLWGDVIPAVELKSSTPT